ncbi:HalOD1 output domain-containing protein [Salinigranum rubrum]|uniref:HalOD1 output domain-containing protein n=1 Tax=Salinigranum rubrum TaxID=755307 RepID=UPI0013A57244|nr:HalOD1 output domain-containing protein [Salinigranum rubrum]
MRTTVDCVSVESLAAAVSTVVADVESCESLDLPPLNESIDTDALQSFCETESLRTDGVGGTVSFAYSDSVVRVATGDPVRVSAAPATDETTARDVVARDTDLLDSEHASQTDS